MTMVLKNSNNQFWYMTMILKNIKKQKRDQPKNSQFFAGSYMKRVGFKKVFWNIWNWWVFDFLQRTKNNNSLILEYLTNGNWWFFY